MKTENYMPYMWKIILLVLLFLSSFSLLTASQESLPDLFIDDAVIQQTAGQKLKITMGNKGSVYPEEKVVVELSFQSLNGAPLGGMRGGKINIPYDKLAPGSLYEFEWNEPLRSESFVLTIRIDHQNRIRETDKKNNVYKKTFSQVEQSIPGTEKLCNLAIGKFYVVPYYGNKIVLRMHILNLGTAPPDKDFLVVLSWDPSKPGEKNSWNLKARNHPPGSEVIISSGQISLQKDTIVNFKCILDPDNQIKESDEQDNERTLTYKVAP